MNFYEDEYSEPDVPPGASMGRLLLHIARGYGKTMAQQQAFSQSVHSVQTHMHTFDVRVNSDKALQNKLNQKMQTIGSHLHFSLEQIAKAFAPLNKALQAHRDPRSDHPAVRGRYLPQPHSMSQANSQHYFRKGRRK